MNYRIVRHNLMFKSVPFPLWWGWEVFMEELLQRSSYPWDFPTPLSLSSISLRSGAGDVVVKAPFQISPWCQKHENFALSAKQNMCRTGRKKLVGTPAVSGAENVC